MDQVTTIQTLPPEILERILTLTRPNLDELLELSQVSSAFHSSAANVPIVAQLPLSDGRVHWLATRGVPVETLVNREPAMFVKDQILKLNLNRLRSAELLGNDYVSSKMELSPHYVEVLLYLLKHSTRSLKQLTLNCDLKFGFDGGLRCSSLLSSFQHLTFLSMVFTNQIELEQKVKRAREGQKLIYEVVKNLPQLKCLYLFACPTDQLVIHSESLERLHIYRSQFAAIAQLKTPNLVKLVLFESLTQLVHHTVTVDNRHDQGPGVWMLLHTIYHHCPSLKTLNNISLDDFQKDKLTEKEWTVNVFEAIDAGSYFDRQRPYALF